MYASSDVNIVMMFFELFLLRKISEFPSGTRTHNLQIAGETVLLQITVADSLPLFMCKQFIV